jgi:hypothetical protein
MAIKESALATVTGTSASDFVRVVTSGGASRKVLAKEMKCLVLTSSSFSALPQTITDSGITADHVVINSVLSNPAAQTGDWTVTTSAGSLSIAGNISGSTTITLYLMKKV